MSTPCSSKNSSGRCAKRRFTVRQHQKTRAWVNEEGDARGTPQWKEDERPRLGYAEQRRTPESRGGSSLLNTLKDEVGGASHTGPPFISHPIYIGNSHFSLPGLTKLNRFKIKRQTSCLRASVKAQASFAFAAAVNAAAFFRTNSCTLSGSCPVSVRTSSDIRS